MSDYTYQKEWVDCTADERKAFRHHVGFPGEDYKPNRHTLVTLRADWFDSTGNLLHAMGGLHD